jgi:hypothetical protein
MPNSFVQAHVRSLSHLAIASCLALFCAGTACAEDGSTAKPEVVYELDPYYSDVGYNIPLTDKPVPTIESSSEAVIYRELMKGSLIPRYMLLEASVYPMPVLGTYLKTHTPGFYRQFDILGGNFNIIESLTTGFQEPWAVSAFFGNVAKLKRPDDKLKENNYGYTGYLISVGAKHIKNNIMIEDDWCELEWKIKGRIDHPDQKLSWSFRIGGKFNQNHDVNNVLFLSLHRSNTDLKSSALAWLENTDFDFRLHFLQHGGKLVRSELIAGKKIPLEGKDYVPVISAGFIWTSPDEYAGQLREIKENRLILVIRPSIEF